MSTILDALAKARQEKEQRGNARPRIIIKSSLSRGRAHGFRILLLAAFVALSGALVLAFIRPPWAVNVLGVFSSGEKKPSPAPAERKSPATSVAEQMQGQKPTAEQPRGFIEILMKSKEMAAKGESPLASSPPAAPDQAAKEAESRRTVPLFLQKLQKSSATQHTLSEKPGKMPSAPTQPANKALARVFKKSEGANLRKTGPPPPMTAKPDAGLHTAKQQTAGPAELYNQGVDMEKADNPQEAAAAYQKAISMDKKYTSAYINLGNLYLNHWGKPWQAISLYRTALVNSPDNSKLHNNLGVAYMELKQFDAAEKEFQKAVDLEEEFVDPVYNMACLFARKGDAATALSWLKKARALGGEEIIQWAVEDQDLVDLRNLPAFQDLLKEVQSGRESLGK